MNQIPQEGEFCGACPCLLCGQESWVCGLYLEPVLSVYFTVGQDEKAKRLPICLKRKPRIVEES